MIVARPREPKRAVRCLLGCRGIATRRGNSTEGLERGGHVRARESEIPVAPRAPTYEQAVLDQASQVRRRRRRRDTRAAGKLSRGKRLATKQRAEHRGTR